MVQGAARCPGLRPGTATSPARLGGRRRPRSRGCASPAPPAAGPAREGPSRHAVPAGRAERRRTGAPRGGRHRADRPQRTNASVINRAVSSPPVARCLRLRDPSADSRQQGLLRSRVAGRGGVQVRLLCVRLDQQVDAGAGARADRVRRPGGQEFAVQHGFERAVRQGSVDERVVGVLDRSPRVGRFEQPVLGELGQDRRARERPEGPAASSVRCSDNGSSRNSRAPTESNRKVPRHGSSSNAPCRGLGAVVTWCASPSVTSSRSPRPSSAEPDAVVTVQVPASDRRSLRDLSVKVGRSGPPRQELAASHEF